METKQVQVYVNSQVCGNRAGVLVHNAAEYIEEHGGPSDDWRDMSGTRAEIIAIGVQSIAANHCRDSNDLYDRRCHKVALDAVGMTEAELVREMVGFKMNSPQWDNVRGLPRWDRLWPMVNGIGELTGEVSEGEGHWRVGFGAMIADDVARAAGWAIDAEEGEATPPRK